MKLNTKLLLLFSITICGMCVGAKDDFPTPAPSADLPPATVPFKPKTTTAKPTEPTTTTTQSSTSTTASTTTSTTEPSTTSFTSTTSSTTTTEAPITTSTTAVPPTPTPEPEIGTWYYKENNKTCIIVQFAAQLSVNYTTTDNKTATALYNIPANQTHVEDAASHCGNGTEDQTIFLQWGPAISPNALALTFHLNQSTHEYTLKEAALSLSALLLPNGRNETLQFSHVADIFAAPVDMSYHCNKPQLLNLADEKKSNTTAATARVSHVQLEAYHKSAGRQFSLAKDCDAIDTPDIVPIAVGCALIALVVVVLIAYLVGRRRAQNRGYVSM